MLKAIELENFKAFGERNRIELAPITLIFGENSAGKSSILQALNLLKQTRESRDKGALILPRTDGGIVDLGGFREMVFDHDLSRDVSIRIDYSQDRAARRRQAVSVPVEASDSEYIGFEVGFNRRPEDHEVQLKAVTLYSSAASGKVAEFQPVELPPEQLRRMARDSQTMLRAHRTPRLSEVRAAKCTSLTSDTAFWSEIFERTKRRADKIADELRQLQNDAQESAQQGTLFKEVDEDRQSWLAQSDEAISFYSSDFTSGEFVERMMRAELETIIALDGFVPLPILSASMGQFADVCSRRT